MKIYYYFGFAVGFVMCIMCSFGYFEDQEAYASERKHRHVELFEDIVFGYMMRYASV